MHVNVFPVTVEELVKVRLELKEAEEWHQEEEERLKHFIDDADNELELSKRQCTQIQGKCVVVVSQRGSVLRYRVSVL